MKRHYYANVKRPKKTHVGNKCKQMKKQDRYVNIDLPETFLCTQSKSYIHIRSDYPHNMNIQKMFALLNAIRSDTSYLNTFRRQTKPNYRISILIRLIRSLKRSSPDAKQNFSLFLRDATAFQKANEVILHIWTLVRLIRGPKRSHNPY